MTLATGCEPLTFALQHSCPARCSINSADFKGYLNPEEPTFLRTYIIYKEIIIRNPGKGRFFRVKAYVFRRGLGCQPPCEFVYQHRYVCQTLAVFPGFLRWGSSIAKELYI